MKTAERFVLVAIILLVFGGVVYVRMAVTAEHQAVLDGVARGDYEIPTEPAADTQAIASTSDGVLDATTIPEREWRRVYPETVPMYIAGVPVEASVADSLSERIQGLSGTPYLPASVVKLFSFGAPGSHAIWMKDMKYALDVLWVDEEGKIVHLEENITPATFPQSFGSPVPAWYVIEAVAGFVDMHNVTVGQTVTLPQASTAGTSM
jgi:hypothetical protein